MIWWYIRHVRRGEYVWASVVWCYMNDLEKQVALENWKLTGHHAWVPPRSGYHA